MVLEVLQKAEVNPTHNTSYQACFLSIMTNLIR
jgi:hypothetical protein